MEEIVPAPQVETYRNKCEFTVGLDAAGVITAGFRLGSFSSGVSVADASECINIPTAAKRACAVFTDFVRASPLAHYDQETHLGVWRQLTVRTSDRTGHVMLTVMVKSPAAEDVEGTAQMAAETSRLVETFKDLALGAPDSKGDDAPAELKIKALFVQNYAGLSNPDQDCAHVKLWGDDRMQENMLGLQFLVSPGAFFQVNTPAAEELYSVVARLAGFGGEGKGEAGGEAGDAVKSEGGEEKVGESAATTAAKTHTTVLDVCCGTGTIGLSVAKFVDEVIGMDLCKAAVADAHLNTALNGIDNATFIAEKAEDVMKKVIQDCEARSRKTGVKGEIIAIVDPPRAGLHPAVLKALRSCRVIDKLVYVSCNPTKSFVADSVMLCGPRTKNMDSAPFRPVRAVPVDMFPHTSHCELVTLFDRGDEETGED